MMPERPIFTYQTRLLLDATQAQVLDDYASLHSRAERSLFAALRAGRALNDLKREFLPRFGITARQFNAVRVGLEGKIDSIKARRPELIAEAQQRIKRAETVLGKLEVRAAGTNKLHHKKRRLATLKARCAALEADHAAGVTRLCFGSKRLFRAQFDLAANGYASYAQWHGISVHQGAALAVARRGLGFSERPPQRPAIVPVRNGGHVTFTLPARNRAKHVWSYWADIRKKLKAAHVAHFRSGEASAPPAPLFSATRTVCSHRNFVAKSHDANRSQHCSESVLEDVPW